MTQIKIEVPANDHIALSAMADALQRIATERFNTNDEGEKIEYFNTDDEKLNAESEHAKNDDMLVNADAAFQALQREEFEETTSAPTFKDMIGDGTLIPTEQDDTLDANGLPWDKRIHSRGKTRLSDDTWRLARKPNDKTDEEWSAYVESVKSELKAVQDIPSDDTAISIEDITQAEINAGTLDEQAVADLTPPVVDEPTAPTLTPPAIDTEAPVAPVTPPTSLTPPVESPSDQPSVTTFEELMIYITGDAKKRGADTDMIKATLVEVDPALIAIPLIGTRADLIPKFVTALEAKLS